MSISYRLLTEGDAPAFLTIRQRSLREHPDMFTSTAEEWGLELRTYIDRIIANPTIGAYDADTLVGHATLGIIARDRSKIRHKVEVWSVYTAPEVRRQGVAREMMIHLIEEARNRGFEAIVLSAASHNALARRLYETLGFSRYATEPKHVKLPDGSYVDTDWMQLELT
jgi:ribosomal protein S18 acetylase RimI-like enzyme